MPDWMKAMRLPRQPTCSAAICRPFLCAMRTGWAVGCLDDEAEAGVHGGESVSFRHGRGNGGPAQIDGIGIEDKRIAVDLMHFREAGQFQRGGKIDAVCRDGQRIIAYGIGYVAFTVGALETIRRFWSEMRSGHWRFRERQKE